MADYYRRIVGEKNGGSYGCKRARSRSQNRGVDNAVNVPTWEKRFCWEVGSVPWKKILDSQKYITNGFSKVVQWNDSACEEAFKNAKLRYRLKINGEPCSIRLPNPDMYIDKIDWNHLENDVDRTVLRELENHEASEVEEEEEEEKENVVTEKIIKPTGWDDCGEICLDIKFRVLTGMVVGDD